MLGLFWITLVRYLTIAPVRGDRLLLCFERQGPEEMNPCVDSRLQCQEWATGMLLKSGFKVGNRLKANCI